MGQSSNMGPASRYHHFVPQFILKNFSHAYKPDSKKGNRRRKSKIGIYPGDKVVYGLKLKGAKVEFIETKVAKTFGIQDLYIDVSHPTNQQHVEEMFGILENRAAEIISKIRKKFEAGGTEAVLRRTERDTIRKFLYIMKYRKPHTRDRFLGDSPDDYKGEDKEDFIEYMELRGFKKPIEVWLDNIKAMLEINMDITSDWEEELTQKAYPLDAIGFIIHTKMYFLSFCTPSSPADEFLMTENGYGIHEGPTSTQTDPDTGEVHITSYTEYHTFAHISPRLTMVARALILPLPVEDVDEEVKEMREQMLEMTLMQHNSRASASSFLHDLPVTKPGNSYTKFVDGVPTFTSGKEHKMSNSDVFYFRIFELSENHVAKINTVFLEEAYTTDIIVFKSRESLRRALEFYLRFEDDVHILKQLKTKERDDEQLVYLKRLEEAVKLLGGSVTAKFVFQEDLNTNRAADQVFDLIDKDEKCLRIYTKLCKLPFQLASISSN